ICPPKTFRGLPHLLFRNNGDGTFTSVADKAGIRVDPKPDARGNPTVDVGKGLAVTACRFNDSRQPSLFLANDSVENFLYLNQGGWRFLDCASGRGVARDERGNENGNSSIAIGDYERNGFASIFCSTHENETLALFRNLGRNGQFLYSSKSAGLA